MWNGTQWKTDGSGVTLSGNGAVYRMTVYDDVSGQALFVGGGFVAAGGAPANNIARWDGSTWSALGAGTLGSVSAMTVFDVDAVGDDGPALIAGGFILAIDAFDPYLSRWQGCRDRTPPVLVCPESVSVSDPRSGPPGEIVSFTVTASDDRDESPSVVCVPPSGSLFPPGITLVQCEVTDDAGNLSSCSFPVSVIRKNAR
jgi:hypothetical protein